MPKKKHELSHACRDFLIYHRRILQPAANEFFHDLDHDKLTLHRAFAVNMFAAHAMDYLHAIRKARGEAIGRSALLRQFDYLYALEDAVLASRKFELVNLINNSLKHVELDVSRKENVIPIEHYGRIRFGALMERKGRIYCSLDNYCFDFGRVVLRSVLSPLTRTVFSNHADVVEFSTGEWVWSEYDDTDTDDPIDKMIEYCNPLCANCGEDGEECECATFIFDGMAGRFEPIRSDGSFNFDEVMSQISGAYSPND